MRCNYKREEKIINAESEWDKIHFYGESKEKIHHFLILTIT